MMHKLLLLATLVAAINCMPQFHLNRPSPHPALLSRQAHFLNTAPSPIQSVSEPIAPQQLRFNIPVRKPANNIPLTPRDEDSLDYEIYQNENANYQFSSNIEDHINDQTQQREETRNGSSVKGSYSYSDGYYKTTVHYIADKDGYRVTGMESIPLDGPHIDLMGTASVSSSAHGTQLNYKVMSVPAPGPVGRIVNH